MPDPPLPPPPPVSPLPSPRRGQPAGPKIATANKEMSSLGLLSLSAGAHFFQLWFKLRNTNVFLVSACCQHFCRACSGATGRAHKLSGEDFEKQFYIFFFPLLGIREIFQFAFPQGCRAKRSKPGACPAGALRNPTSAPARQPSLGSPTQMWPLLDFLSLLSCQARSWLRERSQGGRALGGL